MAPKYAGTLPAHTGVGTDGGASCRIPIAIPPGVAGLEPTLALEYRSARGNSVAGVGWSLTGLSLVSRVGATPAQDGFRSGVSYTGTDRFALDGRRLLAVGGTYGDVDAVYAPEIETWTRAYPAQTGAAGRSGPDSFTVESAAGRTMQYGGTQDSQALAGESVRAWGLNKVEDSFGNVMTVTYDTSVGDGTLYPVRIDYGAGDLDTRPWVGFTYEERPDALPSYAGGHVTSMTRRLKTITTSVGGALVSTYILEYGAAAATGRSVLQSLTRSDATGESLPPVTFEWQDGGTLLFEPPAASVSLNVTGGGTLLPMDLDGNGIVDLVWASDNDGQLALEVMLANPGGSGFSAPLPVTVKKLASGGLFLPMDVNGDGCIDLVYAYDNEEALELTVFLATNGGSGWTLEQGPAPAGPAGLAWTDGLHAADVDGDGCVDLVHTFDDGNQVTITTLYSTGSVFTAAGTTAPIPSGGSLHAGQFDGSGMAGLLYAQDNEGTLQLSLLASGGRAGFSAPVDVSGSSSVAFQGALMVLDVNADGRDDAVLVADDGGTLTVTTFVNDGIRFEASAPLKTQLGGTDRVLPADVTGNGLPDLVMATISGETAQLNVLTATGTGFEQAVASQPTTVASDGGPLRPLDLTGTGKTDLLSTYSADEGQLQAVRVLAAGPYPDLLTAVTDGLGGVTSVDYAPMTDPSIYSRTSGTPRATQDPQGIVGAAVSGSTWLLTPGAAGLAASTPGATPGTRTLDVPRYLVERTTRSDGRGATYARRWRYASALIDLTGRGWLGFASTTAIDDGAGTTTQTGYEQSFPLTGQDSSLVVTRSMDGALIRTHLNVWEPVKRDRGTQQALLTSLTTQEFNFAPPGAQSDVTRTEARLYDDYGNATLVTATASDAPALNVAATYLNSESPWRFGLVTGRKATAGDGSVLKWDMSELDVTTCRPTSSKRWDPVQEQWLETAYGYDSCGNLTSITDPSGATRSATYDAERCSFLKTLTSPPTADGITLTSRYSTDARFGLRVSESRLQRSDDDSPPQVILSRSLDGLGRLTEERRLSPSGSLDPVRTEVWGSDAQGTYREITRLTAWGGEPSAWQRDRLDGLGRTYQSTALAPDGSSTMVVDRAFDSRGNVLTQTLPYAAGSHPTGTVTRTYDAMGRAVAVISPADDGGADTTSIAWQDTRTMVRTDAAGSPMQRATTLTYTHVYGDVRLAERTDSDGTTTFTYDLLARVIEMVDPLGVKRTIAYDGLGREVTATADDGTGPPTTETLAWDDAARTATLIDASRTTSVRTSDALGRLLSVVVGADPAITYAYDPRGVPNAAGRLASVTDGQGAGYAYEYDASGAVSRTTVTIAGQDFAFAGTRTPAGQLATLGFPGGDSQANTYNGAGQLTNTELTNAAGEAVAAVGFSDFTLGGKAQTADFGNGLTRTRTFTPLERLAEEKIAEQSEAALSHRKWSWSTPGLLQSVEDLYDEVSSETFTYDASWRLQSAAGRYGTLAFGYDRGGNLTSKEGVTYQYAGQRVVEGRAAGAAVYEATYDAAGQQTGRTRAGTSQKLSFESGELTSVDDVSFAYDHKGRRVRKGVGGGSTTLYPSSRFEMTKHADGTTAATRLLVARGELLAAVTDGTGTRYAHRDHAGSVRMLTDSAAAVTARIDYMPYGAVAWRSGSESPPRAFQGRIWDAETELYYFGARYYDPTSGRFVTADDRPGGPLQQRDVMNVYAFTINDPVNFRDPTGHSIWDLIGSGIADVGLIGLGAVAGGLGMPVLASTLIGAGVGGLIYDIKAGVSGHFSWGAWGTQVGIGAAVGLIMGLGGAAISAAGAASAAPGAAAVADAAEVGAGEVEMPAFVEAEPIAGGAEPAAEPGGGVAEGAGGNDAGAAADEAGPAGGRSPLQKVLIRSGINAVSGGTSGVVGQVSNNAYDDKPLAYGLGAAATWGALAGVITGPTSVGGDWADATLREMAPGREWAAAQALTRAAALARVGGRSGVFGLKSASTSYGYLPIF
jgi:RHS repeat-associated protein